jgi:hypothetical protein
MYLLAYDTGRRRMTAWLQLGYVLRAAALTDLLQCAVLTDDSGKARLRPGAVVGDPVLDAVCQQIAGSRPRTWRHWVGRRDGAMKRAVRDQLAAAGWIRVEPRRILGISAPKVTVRDTRAVKRLTSMVSAALRSPVDRVDPRDAALVALAASGDLKTALPRATRRRHKERIARLSEQTGPIAKALRNVIRQAQAAAS